MPNVPYLAPQIVGVGQNGMSPQEIPQVAGQNAQGTFNAFRRGDILTYAATGTIVTPSGGTTAGGTSLATTAGPALAAGQGVFSIISSATSIVSGGITITGITSAAAPANTYYVIVTYTNTTGTNESLSSQEFIVICPAGLTFAVNATAAQAPAAAVTFAVYVALYPGYEALQQATKFTTALGTAFTVPAVLTNSIGLARAATNANTNLFGMATDDSNALFYNAYGQVGNQSLFGATMTQQPLTGNDAFYNLVTKLQTQQLEMSLVQAWNPALAGGAVAGLLLDPTTGFFVADTSQSNKILNIVGFNNAPQSVQGGVGLTGTRVIVQFAGTGLI